jgi:hypothetical protein
MFHGCSLRSSIERGPIVLVRRIHTTTPSVLTLYKTIDEVEVRYDHTIYICTQRIARVNRSTSSISLYDHLSPTHTVLSLPSMQPLPSPDDDELLKNLRRRLSQLLVSLREGAEGSFVGTT